MKYKKGKMYELSLAEMVGRANQPRQTMDQTAMTDMIASVNKLGVLEPILFGVDEQANKVIVAGERRVEAARQAGKTTICGIYVSGDHGEIALVENMLRQDLTPIEEAEGLQALMNKQQYTQEELSAIIGKSQTWLSEGMVLNNLAQEIRDDARGNRTVAKSVLVTIARKKKPEQMIAAYQAYKDKLNKVKPSVKRQDANGPQIVFAMLDKTVAKINAINSSAWNDEEKSSYHTALNNLKNEIDLQLNGSTPAASA